MYTNSLLFPSIRYDFSIFAIFQIPEQIKSTNPTTKPNRPTNPIRRPPPSSSGGPLKCFSCGSLLSQVGNCTEFNPSNPGQVQTCGTNEACLLYTYKKSEGETAVLRECFPKSVVLGPIDNPLLPTTDCNLRDVSEPEAGITGVSACLCETSFCNNKQELQTISLVKQPLNNEVLDEEPEFKRKH